MAGDVYVDESCIDCDTCRWMAPEVFGRVGEQAAVVRQPEAEREWLGASRAVVACPTASIGGVGVERARAARRSFPIRLADWIQEADEAVEAVYHLGFHAKSSFGAASWFVKREGLGNVMVDCPRWNNGLAKRLEDLGGVEWIFLTHRDDVADHAKWAERFGAKRVFHEADVRPGESDLASVERLIDGEDVVHLDEELVVIPVPGHTAGSMCLSWRGRVMFTGDHLSKSRRTGRLNAFRSACWYDWDVQAASMERLAEFPFEWVLPGHGSYARLDPGASRGLVLDLAQEMRRPHV